MGLGLNRGRKGPHDTQNNDTEHSNKYQVRFSMTLSKMIHSMMTLKIMTVSMMAFSLMSESHYAECHNSVLLC